MGWLELFYDLVFVAAIIGLGDALSTQVTVRHEVLGPLVAFAGLLVPLWIAWIGFTFFHNRFTLDDALQRALVFAKMFAVGAMAIAAPAVLSGIDHGRFALAFAVAQGLVALMYLRAWRQVPEARSYSRYWGLVFAAGAAVWAASAWAPVPWAYGLWGLGVAAVFASPVSRQSRALAEALPIDMEHLGERLGLLTIIVLGESFVKVLGHLSTPAGVALGELAKAGVSGLITCSIWWIYFDDVAGARVREGHGGWIVWLYGHVPLAVGIAGLGVAVKKTLSFSLGQPPDEAYRWLVAATLALVFVSVAAIDAVTERHNAELSDRARVRARLVSAVLVVLVAQVGGTMSAGLFLLIVGAICLGQIAFDIMMAPYEGGDEAHARATPTAELARRRREQAQAGEAPSGTLRRRNLDEPIRRGTPPELRRDLYFFFMAGSWWRLLGALAFCYLMTNVLFAGLYLLQPGAIAGRPRPSFVDAFSFSVQTMTTIGYGAMSPGTVYGDMIVALEAAVGVLGVALATGLMFAKASRPQASVLFSDAMVLSPMHGVDTLRFRAGNARGNEVVEAQVSVSVLLDDISPEGHHTRRMLDLQLVRSRSPLFRLSWLVMHPINEDSPLHGLDPHIWEHHVVLFIVTMTGFDATYGQPTYTRKIYLPQDVRPGHRFADVLSEAEDGRMLIDFTRFHATEAIVDHTPPP